MRGFLNCLFEDIVEYDGEMKKNLCEYINKFMNNNNRMGVFISF